MARRRRDLKEAFSRRLPRVGRGAWFKNAYLCCRLTSGLRDTGECWPGRFQQLMWLTYTASFRDELQLRHAESVTYTASTSYTTDTR